MEIFDAGVPDIVVTDLLVIGKGMFVLVLLGYLLFTVLVVRQVQMMARALNGLLDLPVRAWAYTQVGVATVVFLLSWVLM